ncbi:MAG: hypothetical protein WCA79_11210 [Anaerolineales bacterium]
MRVTRETLIRIAKENAQERAFNDRDLVAAYLTGSLVSGSDPILGGTADIDLVLVHNQRPGMRREIVKLTPDFHLDILHRSKDEFKSPRELRVDPMLGYEMYDPMLLYQREKFFEFVQAGLRAGFEFHAPALVLARCRKLLAEARKGWIDLSDIREDQAGPIQVKQFLQAVDHATNAIAELNGGPLAERRFLLEFPARSQSAQRSEFTATLFNLLGASNLDDASIISNWIPDWKNAFLAASENAKVDRHVHSARLNYYEKAFEVLLSSESPLASLWPLINTWTLAANVLENDQIKAWQIACEQLGLLGNGFEQRVSDLDHYLDEIDIRFDEIAAANGLETSSAM